MKRKIILLALTVSAVLALCGCGQRSAEDNTTPPAGNQATPGGTAPKEAATPPTPPAPPTPPPAEPPAAAPAAPPAAAPAMTNSPDTNSPPAAH